MVAWNCRPEPFKISVFNLLTPVDSCLPVSIGGRPFTVFGGWQTGQNEGFWRSKGCRFRVDPLSIGC